MKRHFNWAAGVVLAYVTFAGATIGFVAYALNRTVDLVSPDYYARSLQQDRQMDAERNAVDLKGAASVVQSGDGAVVVSVPAMQAADARGSITLYRPSDASADRIVALKTDAGGQQRVPLDGLRAGLWSVHVRWTAQGREFYLEQRVVAR